MLLDDHVDIDVNAPERARARALRCVPGEVAPYVLLPGDPKRAKKIARDFMDDAVLRCMHREFVTFTGTYRGIPVSCVSTGIGSAGAAMVVEDLALLGAKVAIRVGTAGSVQVAVRPGDIVVATGAVRDEGLTAHYVPPTYPAVADRLVTNALIRAAADGVGVHEGIVHTSDGFRTPRLADLVATYQAAGVLAFEMEAAAVLVVAAQRGLRAGTVLAIDGYVSEVASGNVIPAATQRDSAIDRAISVALDAVASLHETLAP